jgi:hypothetical protein
MIATHDTSACRPAPPPPLARAARMVDRWGLVAGVTGVLANILLAVLFATSEYGPYSWTGPANDTVGIVSALAMIPFAAGLLAVCGNSPGLGALTSLAIVAMLVIAAVSLLFVIGLAPFDADVGSSYVGMIFIFGWLFAASRAGRASGRLPRQAGNWGVALGVAGLAGASLLTASALMPAHSVIYGITFGAGAAAAGPVVLGYPVWQIVLSYRLPGYLAHHADQRGAEQSGVI